jgi:hypothetical protein
MRIAPYFFILFLISYSCRPIKYSKREALDQAHYCLEKKHEIGSLATLRNPYFLQFAKTLSSDSIPNKSITDSITILSSEIDKLINNCIQSIEKLKTKHLDTRFFDATLEYFELNRKLEIQTNLLVNSLLNPNSDKIKEKEINLKVEILANQVLTEQVEYEKKESKFHFDNNIIQREVDSIVGIIKNKDY